MTRYAMRTTTVTYPRTIVLRNTGFKTAVGCTAVTHGSWQKKGVKDPGTSVEEKRRAATRGGRDLDEEGPSRGRTRRWFSPRDHSRSLRNPTKRVALLVLGPSRFLDFRVFSNPRTENSWAGSVENERANGEREGISYPSRARTLWSSVQPLNGERSLRLQQKKLCEMTSHALPPFYSPPSRLPILLSSSRDANFFQNDGTPSLPDYQKIPAVFSLEIFRSRHRSPFLSLSFAADVALLSLWLNLVSLSLAFGEHYLGPESGLRAHGFWSSLTLDLDTVCEQSLILHRCRFHASIVDRVYIHDKEYWDCAKRNCLKHFDFIIAMILLNV